jgi:hypothetical protein
MSLYFATRNKVAQAARAEGITPAATDAARPSAAHRAFALAPLGAASESLSMDSLLKSNSSRARTHPLFRQSYTLYELIPNLP